MCMGHTSRCFNVRVLEPAGTLKNDRRATSPGHCQKCECEVRGLCSPTETTREILEALHQRERKMRKHPRHWPLVARILPMPDEGLCEAAIISLPILISLMAILACTCVAENCLFRKLQRLWTICVCLIKNQFRVPRL